MRFLAAILLASLPLFACAQLEHITAAFNTTLADGVDLFAKISAFTGDPATGLLDAIKIQAGAYQVQKDILAADHAVQAVKKFTDAESVTIATAVVGLVSPIKLLLKTLTDKKPQFQAVRLGLDDLTPIVLQVITKTKTLAASLGQNIAGRLGGGLKDAAPALLQELNAAFDQAISAYSVD